MPLEFDGDDWGHAGPHASVQPTPTTDPRPVAPETLDVERLRSVRVLGYTIDQLQVAVATASLHDPAWPSRALAPEDDPAAVEQP